TSYKSWSVPVRAKPCETQSLTESLSLTGFFVFFIYGIKVSQCTRLHFVLHYNGVTFSLTQNPRFLHHIN
ncbi:MAG: hypothetical protein KHY81_06050, partial [Lachnospiraceae bacterium]|nr:hypothetical protein [Lachnospiraceae bacterium]